MTYLLSLLKKSEMLAALGVTLVLFFFSTAVNFSAGYLIFAAFVPLFLITRVKKSGIIFFIAAFSYFYINFFWFVFYWPVYFNAALYLYLSLFWMLFWLISRRVWEKQGDILIIPLIFTAVEYLRSIGPLGFISGTPAYALWKYKVFYPVIRIGGIWLADFIIILINVFIAKALSRKVRKLDFIVVVLSVAFVILADNYVDFKQNVMPRFSAIVFNTKLTPQQKWAPGFAANIEKWYDNMLRQVPQKHSDFIIFPETAAASYLLKSDTEKKYYQGLAARYDAAVVVGTKDYIKKGGAYEYHNTAAVFYPDGVTDKYYKVHPVPFAEKRFFFSSQKLSKSGAFEESASDYKVFRGHSDIPFAVLICYETTYPDLVRRFISNGAKLLINISNEGALSRSHIVSMQLVRETLFRAIENNTVIIKSANRGYSAVFYPDGTMRYLGGPDENKTVFVTIN